MTAHVRQVNMPEMTAEQRRIARAGEALHRDGASPAGALELLAAILEDRTWERLSDREGKSFAGRFKDFVKAKPPYGLDFDPDQLPKVLQLRHPHESAPDVAQRMGTMRDGVRRMLNEEIEPVSEYGGDRRSVDYQERTTHLISDTGERVIARLKRDDAELAEKVFNGEVTPNAAARMKGWRRPRIVVSSPDRIAASLRKHMTSEDLRELARLLKEGEV